MDSSIQRETTARLILARLLFRKEDVYKKAGVLSGGEKVKLAISKIILSDARVCGQTYNPAFR